MKKRLRSPSVKSVSSVVKKLRGGRLLSFTHKFQRPSLNPNGIPSFSPALRRRSYAGKTARRVINPERVAFDRAGPIGHGRGFAATLSGLDGISDA